MRHLLKFIPPVPRAFAPLILQLLLVSQFLRGLFLWVHWKAFAGLDWSELGFAFLHGLRFDVSAVLWINLPLILVALFLPKHLFLKKWIFSGFHTVFFLVNAFFINTNITDVEMYRFSGRRMTIDQFAIGKDIADQSLSMLLYNWQYTLLFFVVFGMLFILQKKFSRRVLAYTAEPDIIPIWQKGPVLFIGVVLVFLGLRGGIGVKPVSPIHGYTQGSSLLGALTLNSTFTIIKSKKSDQLPKIEVYNSEDIPGILGSWAGEQEKHWGSFKGYNVVLFVMESFAFEYTGLSPKGGKSYTPFLKSLAEDKSSRSTVQGFANGRRSIDAMPSLLVGIPSFMTMPFVSSNYQSNEIHGLGHQFQKANYATLFFHGARNGSMHIDSLSKKAGIQDYYGLDEYPQGEDFDGAWGVYDEPFFQFAAQKISEQQTPFFATIFSLSSHQPYSVPEKYKGKFPKGSLEIHESLGYGDWSLQKFFETAKSMDWFKKTLFIITADHTSLTDHPGFTHEIDGFRVPIVFYAPGAELPAMKGERIIQHIDLVPTLTNLLSLPRDKQFLLGRDAFSRLQFGEAYNLSYDGFWYLSRQDGFLKLTESGHKQALPKDQAGEFVGEANPKRMQAILQYFFEGLISNSWYQESANP